MEPLKMMEMMARTLEVQSQTIESQNQMIQELRLTIQQLQAMILSQPSETSNSEISRDPLFDAPEEYPGEEDIYGQIEFDIDKELSSVAGNDWSDSGTEVS